MIKSIYVGNLPFRLKSETLHELFEAHGEVYSVKLIYDRETGRPRGFGFIEMDQENIAKAVEAMNGYDCEGRNLIVSEAKEPKRSFAKSKRSSE